MQNLTGVKEERPNKKKPSPVLGLRGSNEMGFK